MYNCNIVVIDDDTIILELVQIILKDVTSGEIYVFSDSKQALNYVQSDSIDKISLVICDWLMPDFTGLDILAALRKSKPHCPFLMLTANATKQLVVDSMRLGATDFILKPFHTDDLLNKVERVIRDAEIC
jgi:two-component system chemotaxis response regulator CheY|tara:strand:- start:353 stop:742 length:390 start_codon:yes stop_codon:yes gene_type:complete